MRLEGVVFTEFIEIVEENGSLGMENDILDDCGLESGGAHTSICVDDYQRMFQLLKS